MVHQSQSTQSNPQLDQLLEQVITSLKQSPAKAAPQGALNPGQALLQKEGLARMIDHTLLKADATREEIERVCQEARKHQFATVCVNSSQIPLVSELLLGSPGAKTTLPIAVIGFPLGACATAAKVFETREAIRLGAREIDMVIALGALKDGNYGAVHADILAVVQAAGPIPVKVILETALLNQEQKIVACVLSKAAGAAFVKTSTGFSTGGATAEDIALMRRVVGPEMGVKASGGVRTYDDAIRMIEAGATRIGASSSVAIVSHAPADGKSGQY